MKKNDIKNSFGSINPDENQVKKMFDVISGTNSKKRRFLLYNENFYKKAVPVMAMVILVGSLSIVYYAIKNTGTDNPGILTSQSPDDFITMCNGKDYSGEDRILIDNKIYVRLTQDDISYYSLQEMQFPEDKGEKIATISDKSNEYFDNCDVYRFEQQENLDIVAVETPDGFIFFIFEQYTE